MLDKLHCALVQNAPAFFRLPVKLVPSAIQQALMLETLKRVFQEALQEGDLAFLEHRWLEINVSDIGFKSFISFADNKLLTAQHIDMPDVCFSGNLNDLILIVAKKEDPDTLFFQRRLCIEGDTELGLEVKNLMDSLDLETLPALLRQGLISLADFVKKGLDHVSYLNETAYVNKS